MTIVDYATAFALICIGVFALAMGLALLLMAVEDWRWWKCRR